MLAKCGPSPAEVAWLQQKGRSPRLEKSKSNKSSSKLLGTHPLKSLLERPSCYQVGEAAQLRWYLPAQLVVVEFQKLQIGEAAQLRRYLPAQLVVAEVQISSGWRGCSSSAGISPLRALSWRSRSLRLERLPSSAGISPLK